MQDYVAPSLKESGFNCPHCGAYAFQQHRPVYYPAGGSGVLPLENWTSTQCARCVAISMWHRETLVWPTAVAGPLPHAKMPEVVRADYEEARALANKSPRAAAALLRLAVQRLCAHLGAAERNLDDAIATLVKKGLAPSVQQALDVVRITGNNAVHPGQLDIRDDPEIVGKLFRLLNYIVEQLIAAPEELKAIWEKMPEGARAATAKRDSK